MVASEKGHGEIVTAAYCKRVPKSTIPVNTGRTALTGSQAYGHGEVVELLIEKGADSQPCR